MTTHNEAGVNEVAEADPVEAEDSNQGNTLANKAFVQCHHVRLQRRSVQSADQACSLLVQNESSEVIQQPGSHPLYVEQLKFDNVLVLK